jgi:excinuclease ABC subunit B
MAEDLTEDLEKQEIRVKYIHHNIEAMERTELLRDLRLGLYDVLVGINLLREGIDLPEVTLVAILDADKEGFLRSEQSLIQTIGRAARNAGGKVIMYADRVTRSMRAAIDETERRRKIQKEYNDEHGITPQTVKKEVRELISIGASPDSKGKKKGRPAPTADIPKNAEDRKAKIEELKAEMGKAAKELRFEEAAFLRDRIRILETTK